MTIRNSILLLIKRKQLFRFLIGALSTTIDNWLTLILGRLVNNLQMLIRSIKYGLVGGISAVTDLTIFIFLIKWWEAPWIIALFFSLTASGFVNFYLTRIGVYNMSSASKKNEINGFFIIAGISLLLNYTLFNIMLIMNTNLFLSRVVVIGLVFVFNFLSREFLYRKILH